MKWHVDSGHGWLQVPWEDIIKLGIADKISSYSYMAGLFVYLEEDCDAGIYLKASGRDAQDFDSQLYQNAPIRNYPRFDVSRSIYAQILLQTQ